MKEIIEQIIFKTIKHVFDQEKITIAIKRSQVRLEKVANMAFGDFSTNISMVLKLNQEIVDKIINQLQINPEIKQYIDKIEFKQPGFLNFYIKNEFLTQNVQNIVSLNKKQFFTTNRKSFLIEHASPNTNKALHIGHLRNTVLAMAIIRILKALNHKVVADCLFNDRGVHICKAMLGYLRYNDQNTPIQELLTMWEKQSSKWPQPTTDESKDAFVGKYYIAGTKLETEEKYKEEIQWLLKEWENNHKQIRKLWQQLNNWFYNGFSQIFKLIDSQVDHYWYESQFYNKAKDLLKTGVEQGVLKVLEDGAILTQLQNYGLTDTIVQRSDGTAMYFTQDIYLTKMKTSKFACDQYLWVIGPEQKLHMQQVFAVCEQLRIGKKDTFKHLSYGAVCNKDGSKMSSRSGEVLSIIELLQEIVTAINMKMETDYQSLQSFNSKEQQKIIQHIALGSIKYAMLKLEREQDLKFDINEAIDLRGNGGPYIQYTYARCCSILNKVAKNHKVKNEKNETLSKEEKVLLRHLLFFKDSLTKAGENFMPHILATYLFELAQSFSSFYEKNRIIDADHNQKLRIDITKAVANILKWGLELLGIEVMNKL